MVDGLPLQICWAGRLARREEARTLAPAFTCASGSRNSVILFELRSNLGDSWGSAQDQTRHAVRSTASSSITLARLSQSTLHVWKSQWHAGCWMVWWRSVGLACTSGLRFKLLMSAQMQAADCVLLLQANLHQIRCGVAVVLSVKSSSRTYVTGAVPNTASQPQQASTTVVRGCQQSPSHRDNAAQLECTVHCLQVQQNTTGARGMLARHKQHLKRPRLGTKPRPPTPTCQP